MRGEKKKRRIPKWRCELFSPGEPSCREGACSPRECDTAIRTFSASSEMLPLAALLLARPILPKSRLPAWIRGALPGWSPTLRDLRCEWPRRTALAFCHPTCTSLGVSMVTFPPLEPARERVRVLLGRERERERKREKQEKGTRTNPWKSARLLSRTRNPHPQREQSQLQDRLCPKRRRSEKMMEEKKKARAHQC